MPPLTSTQKVLIGQFTQITGTNERVAQKLLRAAGWKIDQASDTYFSQSGGSAPVEKSRDALEKLFESYCDQKNDEPNTVGVDGTIRYLTDLGVNLEDASMLVLFEIVKAQSVGELLKDGFVDGWMESGNETLAKQKSFVKNQIHTLSTDAALFKKVYRHAFVCAREKGQKGLAVENAITYWGILFASPGKPLTTGTIDWTALWTQFLNEKWTKSVNKDMWNQTLEFFTKALDDETLSFWNEDGAWPGVIDDFVAYAKDKRGDVPEIMETDD